MEKREGRVSFDSRSYLQWVSFGVFADMNQTQGFRNNLTSAITFVASTGRQFDHINHQYAKMVSDELSKPLCRKSISAGKNRQNFSNVKMGWALQKQNSS